jgi:hypothetical protein
VAAAVTLVLRAMRAPAGTDETEPADYHADAPPAVETPAAEREVSAQDGLTTQPRGRP